MEKKEILFKRFDGGWNSEDASDILQLHESPESINVKFLKGGAIAKDDGMVEVGTDSEVATIKTLINAPNRNGINWLLKTVGTKLKIYDSESELWFSVKTGLTAGLRWGHVVFNNVLYLGNNTDDAMSMDLGMVSRLESAVTTGDAIIEINAVDILQFESSGDVFINNVLVSYTGISGNTLTGCSNAVDTPTNYLVTQALETYAGNPKGSMYIMFGGRLIIAGVKGAGGSTIYGSKATDRTDFVRVGGGIANDAFFEPLAAKVNSIKMFYDDSSQERIMSFLSNNKMYTTNVDDDATLGTLVMTNFFKDNVTAQNHFGTVVDDNNIFHIDLDNQIRTLGPVATDGSGRNFSDSISVKHRTLFRDEYLFDNASGDIINNEYWLACKEGGGEFNNRMIVWDKNKSAWRKRTGVVVADIIEFDNKVTIADQAQNKVYQITPNELTDNHNPIYFEYNTPDIDFTPLSFERVRAVRMAGVISENCEFTVKVFRDFGSVLLGEFVISGSNENIINVSKNVPGAIGQVAFGGVPFGGEEGDDRKVFIAHLELTQLPDFENFRIQITNNQAGVYLEIGKIKPLIFTQKLDYFPNNYIIK